MSTRGSALDRAIKFFEESTLREARAAYHIVSEVMQQRLSDAQAKATGQIALLDKPRRTRRKRQQATEGTGAATEAGTAAAV